MSSLTTLPDDVRRAQSHAAQSHGAQSNHLASALRPMLESLEQRRLLTVQINYANFASTTGLATNGYGVSPTTSANALVLTDGNTNEARSVFYTTQVPIDTFTTSFVYQGNANPNSADGFALVFDTGPNTDLGNTGGDLGYTNGTFGLHSLALEFNLFNFASYGSTAAVALGDTAPGTYSDLSPVDLHNGDPFDVTVTYDGTTLIANVTDADDPSDTQIFGQVLNLSGTLGSDSAYVGFTAGTGSLVSDQQISSWTYSGTSTSIFPTITSNASATPSPVTGTTTALSVGADSNDGGNDTFDWSLIKTPPGAATPNFSDNNDTTASSTTATFHKDGTYDFLVIVTNNADNTTFSEVSVVVDQTITSLKLAPHAAQIHTTKHEQFTETAYDQFGHAMRTQPTPDWSIVVGSGDLHSLTGFYTAPATPGHLQLKCTVDSISDLLGATIVLT
jgi:hypothetical protein